MSPDVFLNLSTNQVSKVPLGVPISETDDSKATIHLTDISDFNEILLACNLK